MSKPTPKFKGRIENLQFIPDDPVKYKQRLTELNGKQVNTVITLYRDNRSDKQNRYYWEVIIGMIAQHCGYRQDECMSVHEELKRRFLGTCGRLNIPKSSAKLNTVDFEDYQRQIREWASMELSLYIPLPNEIDY